MNYELALKLDNAGFDKRGFWVDEQSGIVFKTPTLSELIEACGDGFKSLTKTHKGVWSATHKKQTKHWDKKGEAWSDVKSTCMSGKTPEEAVANLWIELNK